MKRTDELLDLSGKVAVVTGGSRGIGRAVAEGMALAGADVVIASRKLENCETAAREIAETTGRRAVAIACHVGKWADCDRLVDIRDLQQDAEFSRYRDDPFTPVVERDPVDDEVDVVIVGGGIAEDPGEANLRMAGIDESASSTGDVESTWYWNRYPGVMCDVESYMYIPVLPKSSTTSRPGVASGERRSRGHLQRIADRYHLSAMRCSTRA